MISLLLTMVINACGSCTRRKLRSCCACAGVRTVITAHFSSCEYAPVAFSSVAERFSLCTIKSRMGSGSFDDLTLQLLAVIVHEQTQRAGDHKDDIGGQDIQHKDPDDHQRQHKVEHKVLRSSVSRRICSRLYTGSMAGTVMRKVAAPRSTSLPSGAWGIGSCPETYREKVVL